MKELIGFVILVWWIAGFVLAKTFWSTVFCIIPPYSFYVVLDFIFTKCGIVQ